MAMTTTESSTKVLVTRPKHQSAGLCKQLIKQGFLPISFPVIDIKPIANKQRSAEALLKNSHADFLIFVSANAVLQADALVNQQWPKITGQIVAIGPKTSKALESIGLITNMVAKKSFDSEQLLELLSGQINDKSCLIIKGEGGRVFLAEQLHKKGMLVNSVDVYKRVMPTTGTTNVMAPIQYITITSQLALSNLFLLLAPQSAELKNESTFVVFSKRIADYATELGCQHIIISSEASDLGLLSAILEANQR